MYSRVLLVVILICAFSGAHACSYPEWMGGHYSKSPQDYARGLLAHASAVLYAHVVSSNTIVRGDFDILNVAQIEVKESFKGAPATRVIYTYVRYGNCGSLAFVEGETRLFILLESRDGSRRLFEPGGWHVSKFSKTDVLAVLRKSSNLTAVRADAGSAPSGANPHRSTRR